MDFAEVSNDLKYVVREMQTAGLTDDPLYADLLALHRAFSEWESAPQKADSGRQKQILLDRFSEILGKMSRKVPPTSDRIDSYASLQKDLSDLGTRLSEEDSPATMRE